MHGLLHALQKKHGLFWNGLVNQNNIQKKYKHKIIQTVFERKIAEFIVIPIKYIILCARYSKEHKIHQKYW